MKDGIDRNFGYNGDKGIDMKDIIKPKNKITKIIGFAIPFLFVMMLGLNSCTLTEVQQANELIAAQTNAMETLESRMKTAVVENMEATYVALTLTPPATATPTLEPTLTPLPTLTPEPTQDVEPSLLALRQVSCLWEPVTWSSAATVFEEGTTIQTLGRSEDDAWWLALDENGYRCWIPWDVNIEPQGGALNLPIQEIPREPTNTPWPTPWGGIAFSYQKTIKCSSEYYAVFAINNLNYVNYESATVTVKHVGGDQKWNSVQNNIPFMTSASSCSSGEEILPANESAFIKIRAGTDSSTNYRAFLTICTENGMNGECVNTSIDYTP